MSGREGYVRESLEMDDLGSQKRRVGSGGGGGSGGGEDSDVEI